MVDNKITLIKIGLLGDSNVGKTSICNTFSGDESCDCLITIGTDKFEKKIKLENGEEIKLIFWDTPGAERFRSTAFKIMKGFQGIFLVFDVTSKDSFNQINIWLDEIKEYCLNPILVLLGNKIDKVEERWNLSKEEIDNFVKQKNLMYFETSAKTNVGINESFNYLINNIYNTIIKQKELKVKNPEVNKSKKLKKKDEIFDYKIEYEKLKKDYDNLKKNYDKIINDNTKLNNELNKMNNIISDFENKVKDNLNEINNLKNNILQKEDEILTLKLKIKNIESFDKISFNNDDILYVHFITSDQNINCPIKCLKTDTFAEVEERLYQKYQEYREANNKFLSKGKSIMRFKKIIENNINNGDKIELIKFE